MNNHTHDQTVKTYQENFGAYVEGTPHEITGDFKVFMDAFISHIPAGGRVFEFGSAFGRDARYMREKGIAVLCTDIIHEGLAQLAHEGFETAYYDFRE